MLLYGDCISEMKKLESNSIDMILTDLPYGTTGCSWDMVIPLIPLWAEYKRLIKPKGAIALFGTEPFCSLLRTSNLGQYKYDWFWVKNDAGDCMNAKNKPMRKIEKILIFSKGTTANRSNSRMNYFPQGLISCEKRRSGVDYGKTGGSFKVPRPSHHAYTQKFTNYPTDVLHYSKDRNRLHPTQKPVALLEFLIKSYTEIGSTVLDSCMGSASTGVACFNSQRKFIGIEDNVNYFKVSGDRLQETK